MPFPRRHPPAPGKLRRQGFTLIEVVAAFAILALGLGLSMSIATSAIHQARRAATFTEASLHARSLLDTIGAGERLEEGTLEGEFDDRYSWQLDIVEWEPELIEGLPLPSVQVLSPVQMYRLELTVRWQEGEHARESRYATLRTLTPAP